MVGIHLLGSTGDNTVLPSEAIVFENDGRRLLFAIHWGPLRKNAFDP